jgi:hypothetical protein
VPDAVDAGVDYVSPQTYLSSLLTDIPEDFQITDTRVQIPQGATHLFITASDCFYDDNSDSDSDFAVSITLCTCPVGDLDADGFVNYDDMAILARQLHSAPGTPSAYLYADGIIDILDLALLAETWLGELTCE